MDRSHMRLEPDQCNIHILDRACLNSSEYADGASHGFRWRCIERPCLARAVEAHTAKTPYSCRQTDHRARKCRLQCPDSSRRFEPYWVDESPSWHHIHCMAATSSQHLTRPECNLCFYTIQPSDPLNPRRAFNADNQPRQALRPRPPQGPLR
jgi:hypothetical protein